jgi:hypothetical protein
MIIPPGFLASSFQLSLAGFSRSAYITLGHENDSGSNDPQVIASALLDTMLVANSFASVLDNNVLMQSCRVSIGQDGGEPLVGVDTGTVSGSANISSTPANVALLVHKRTASGGRRHRGRMFIPWMLSEATVEEDGTIQTTPLNTLQTAMNNWRSAMVTANLPPVLLHSAGLTITPAPTPISSFQVDRLVATQRRRLGRR